MMRDARGNAFLLLSTASDEKKKQSTSTKAKRKKRVTVPTVPTSCNVVSNASNYLRMGGGGNLQRTLEERIAKLSQAAVKDLKKANTALAEELLREKAEHDQDITDAHATVQQLQDALNKSQVKLEHMESVQGREVQELQRLLEASEADRKEREGAARQLQASLDEMGPQLAELRERVSQGHATTDQLKSRTATLEQTRRELHEAKEHACQSDAEVGRLKQSGECLAEKLDMANARATAAESSLESLRKEHAEQAHKMHGLEGEVVRVQQLLDIEKELHAQLKQEVAALRAENKEMLTQKTRDSSVIAAAEDIRRQWESLQLERNALESALMARNAELEHLKADNKRYANDWNSRESSLVSSHELRISNLMADLTAKDKLNGELHSELHKARSQTQADRIELQTTKAELQAFTEKATKAEKALAASEEDAAAFKQALRSREQELSDLQNLHNTKVQALRNDLVLEHRNVCDMQRRAEVLSAQLEGRDVAAASLAASHEKELACRDQQVSDLKASLRELSDKLAAASSTHTAAVERQQREASDLRQQNQTLSSDVSALKASLDAAAAAAEVAIKERSDLQEHARILRAELEQARFGLQDAEDRAEHATVEMRSLQAAHRRELDSKARVMQDVLTAMQHEETAKTTAQSSARAALDKAAQLEDEVAELTANLEQAEELRKDIETERDEAVATLRRASQRADLTLQGHGGGAYEWVRRPRSTYGAASNRAGSYYRDGTPGVPGPHDALHGDRSVLESPPFM